MLKNFKNSCLYVDTNTSVVHEDCVELGTNDGHKVTHDSRLTWARQTKTNTRTVKLAALTVAKDCCGLRSYLIEPPVTIVYTVLLGQPKFR